MNKIELLEYLDSHDPTDADDNADVMQMSYSATAMALMRLVRQDLAACGRKRTLISPNFYRSERPLSRKAVIRESTRKICNLNVRFTLRSGHSANIG